MRCGSGTLRPAGVRASRPRLADLCQLARLTGDSELKERLGPIVRSRTWEAASRRESLSNNCNRLVSSRRINPRKEVVLLLDYYLPPSASAKHRSQTPTSIVNSIVVGSTGGISVWYCFSLWSRCTRPPQCSHHSGQADHLASFDLGRSPSLELRSVRCTGLAPRLFRVALPETL